MNLKLVWFLWFPVSTYPACKNWGCKVLDWFNSSIYRLATTRGKVDFQAQNAKMGQKWPLIFRLQFEPIWCLVPTGARHSNFLVLPTCRSLQWDQRCFQIGILPVFPLSSKKKHGIYLQVLYLTTTCSTCNTSVYARIPYTVRGSTSVLNIKKERF